MTILQMRYFQAVCNNNNNISKAAKTINISQPSISNAIKELENEFGIRLFTRANRSLSLTFEGNRLLEMINKFLEQFDSITQIMMDLGEKRNLIRLGIPPILGYLILPKIYTNFSKRYPNTEISIIEAGSSVLMENIRNNICDIAFVPHRDTIPSEFKSLPVLKLETVYCVSEKHPLAVYDHISIENLANEPLVMFKDSFVLNKVIMNLFKEKNISPNIVLFTDQLSTAQKLIRECIATGFMSKEIAESMTGVKSVSLENPLYFTYSLIWSKNCYMYSGMNDFIEYVKKSEIRMLLA